MAASRALNVARRGFASQAAKPSFVQRWLNDAPSQSALTEELAGVPALSKTTRSPAPITVTSLSNGVKVATKDDGSAVASVGIFVKAGSRYDAAPGTSHVLEHMAFNSTQKRSALKIQRDVEDLGATVTAQTGREVFAFAGEALRDNLDGVLRVLTQAVTEPKLWPWEVKESKAAFTSIIHDLEANPKTALLEGLHAAAFGPATPLGHSQFASVSDLDDIDENTLRSFLAARVNGVNVVVVGNNVKHDVFAKEIDALLMGLPEGVSTTGITASVPGVHQPAPATFLGGETLIRNTGGGAAHVAVGLSAPSLSSKQLHAMGVLQALLGSTGAHGGAAGAVRLGPQRLSRIARSVHTESHSFIRSLTSFALPYSDVGMFGLAGSCADHEASRLVDTIAAFLKDAASLPVSASELTRARQVYKLAYAVEAEARAGGRDDIAHQLLLTGRATPVTEGLKAIDAVTAADVQAVAKSLLASAPAVAAIATPASLPRYDRVAALLK